MASVSFYTSLNQNQELYAVKHLAKWTPSLEWSPTRSKAKVYGKPKIPLHSPVLGVEEIVTIFPRISHTKVHASWYKWPMVSPTPQLQLWYVNSRKSSMLCNYLYSQIWLMVFEVKIIPWQHAFPSFFHSRECHPMIVAKIEHLHTGSATNRSFIRWTFPFASSSRYAWLNNSHRLPIQLS